MDEAAKRFARRVLMLHVILLFVVVGVALLGGQELFLHARAQALHQEQEREKLVAAQTASGIESYYTSILSNLELDKRVAGDPLMPRGRSPLDTDLRSRLTSRLLWHQLEDRAIGLFSVDVHTMNVQRPPEEPLSAAEQALLDGAKDWLAALPGPALSEPRPYPKGAVVLLANPLAPMGRTLVALVPLRDLDRRFFTAPDRFPGLELGLLDAQGRTIVASDNSFVGLAAPPTGSTLRKFLEAHLGRRAGTELITTTVPGFPPSILSIQPLNLPGVHWSVVVRSSTADIDDLVNRLFGRLITWGLFLVAAVVAILVSTAILLIRGRVRMERLEHDLLTRELAKARTIQLDWLPDPAHIPAWLAVAAVNQPAQHISGDFYNWFDLPDGRHAIVIGDVTGHGMSAAFLMSTTQMLVRAALTRVGDPGHALEVINRELCLQPFRGQFVTLQLLVVDPRKRTVDLATAGHPAPLIGIDGSFKSLHLEPQLLLGVEPHVSYHTECLSLAPGAVLLLYTDGVTEAEGAGGRQFGIAGLCAALQGCAAAPQTVVDRVIGAVRDYSSGGELVDDLTLVAVAVAEIKRSPNA